MYRAVTHAVLHHGVDPADAAGCARIARDAHIEVGPQVLLDGADVSSAIRGPDVTAAVSTVSAHPEVRSILVDRQRAWVDERDGGVVEGRDIGTVVFPAATVKVFLTASDDERARRRTKDEHDAARQAEVDEVRDDLARRDRQDSSRQVSPLRAADDARTIDTTGRPASEVVDEIVRLVVAATAQAG
jgi:cytidylate kinase